MRLFSYIHREGWKFALISFLMSVLLTFVWLPLGFLSFIKTFFILWFFRDPERKTPQINNSIISAADGKICLIDKAYLPEEAGLGEVQMKRVCVFMNVLNVHVNRSPINGIVEKVIYKSGSFFNASLDKASEKNERSSLVLKTTTGTQIVVVQIAGLIARRILSFVKPKDNLSAGERFGLIRFGSRVDIYLPLDAEIKCALNDNVIAGETVLAQLIS